LVNFANPSKGNSMVWDIGGERGKRNSSSIQFGRIRKVSSRARSPQTQRGPSWEYSKGKVCLERKRCNHVEN